MENHQEYLFLNDFGPWQVFVCHAVHKDAGKASNILFVFVSPLAEHSCHTGDGDGGGGKSVGGNIRTTQ